jgi:ectoine hydroxylase-related dioxygenase (phytanoyl-CoA dioxygenase family)
VQDFDRDGFSIVERALAPDELAALTEAVDRTWAELGGGTVHELAFLPRDPIFLELLDHPATLPIVTELLGWNIYLYHCHLDIHPPVASAEPQWRWHQDGGRQNLELESPRPRLSVKVAYFLTDVAGPENGCLWVIPGSHRRETLARPDNGSVLPPGAEPLLVPAGTAVVFDRRLWHARGDNVSNVTRKALFYAYTYRWIRPRDELRLDPKLLETVTPTRRQLLGAGTSAIGHWIPTKEDVPLRTATVL